jgi:tetratricopeptide (TPR) repeat protein
MFSSLLSLGACLFCLCQSASDRASPGWDLWQQGQQALLAGQSNRAIELYEESLAVDPHLTRNYLGLAAAWLDRGEDARACLHLTLYVAAHPEHLAVRVQYAELLHRLRRLGEARVEFERFIADAQEQDAVAREHLVHCHSRLVEIAAERDDEYDEHLHRGIGLFLLAREQIRQGGEEPSPEGLLCRAAAELTLARRSRPDEARPWWYLHRVWSSLALSQPAGRSLRAAAGVAPFSDLTPAEQRDLDLACRQRDQQRLTR